MTIRRRTVLQGMLGASALIAQRIKTYSDVSQFWVYDSDEFLKHPVYNRESWPGGKYLEP